MRRGAMALLSGHRLLPVIDPVLSAFPLALSWPLPAPKCCIYEIDSIFAPAHQISAILLKIPFSQRSGEPMSRATLYDLERKLKAAFRAENEIKRQSLEIQVDKYKQQNKYCNYKFPKADAFICKTFISKEVIASTTRLSEADGFNEIDTSIDYCKSFVGNLMGADLADVRIFRVNILSDLAEGRAISCAEKEHAVLLPPKGKGFVSVDLLLHELGHTAEFTLRRQILDNDCFTNFGILSEAIAHFCQFRYLRESGTGIEKLSAIASVLPGYVAMKVVEAAQADLRSGGNIVPELVFDRPEVSEVKSAMGPGNFWGFLQYYRNLPAKKVYDHKVVERMGAILALHMLDEPETIRKICVAKPLATLEDTLKSIDVDTGRVLDFSKADELIKKFLN